MKTNLELVINPDNISRSSFVLASELGPGTGQRHQHERDQLIYADWGVMTVTTSKGRWVVTPHSGVWVPGGVSHQVIRKSRVHLSTLYGSKSTQPDSQICHVVSITPLLKSLLIEAGDYPIDELETTRQSRLLEVLRDEVLNAQPHKLSLPIPQDKRAKFITDKLIDEPGNTMNMDDWCKQAGASRRTLERAFQGECGMSFLEWRQQIRLLHAIELLSMNYSVTKVALSVGYSDISHFINIFKRHLGITPGRYFST